MVQMPEARKVTTPLFIEQIDPPPLVTVSATESPDVEVAVGVYVESFTGFDGTIEVNATVCVPFDIEIER